MKNSWDRARVLNASDRGYLETVLALLDGAKKEIALAFYLIEPDENEGPRNPVNRLLDSLIRASTRGVTVRLVLNSNFRFQPKAGISTGFYFENMAKAGIQISTLLPRRRLHDKLIVIDGRFVVEGSMNWSEAALLYNFESATVIDSPAYAAKKLARITAMTLPALNKSLDGRGSPGISWRPAPAQKASKNMPDLNRPLLEVPPSVQVPAAILEKDCLPRMIRDSDTRAADLYLLLLGQAEAAQTNSFDIDLESAALALKLPRKWTRSALRRQMIKTLDKLAARYRLLEFKLPYAGDAHIELKQLPGVGVRVPGLLLTAEHLAQASTAETFLAIAKEVLEKEGVDINTLSAPQLERRFGIGKSAVVRARRS